MDLFSQAQVDALRRLKDAFEQKLLDEDEYKAEKAKVLNATPAAAPAPAEDDFELVGVQTPAERAAESRRRAEAEGNVVEIDDDEPAAPAPPPPARKKPAARPDARPTPRHEEPVMLRCRRVYFGTALRRDVSVVFAPSCITMVWRSDTSRLYIETRLAASHMTSFNMYHRSHNVRAGDNAALDDFVAIGLRQAPPHLRSIEGFEPTDDAGPRKYIVIVLEGDALATFKLKAVPAVIWGGHAGWPAAPVIGTVAAARPLLEGVAAADAAAGFVVPPVIQSYTRRAPDDDAAPAAPPVRPRLGQTREEVVVVRWRPKPARKDIVPLTTAEKAAVLHAIAQLDGKATQRKVRRAAESALGAPEGALDAKKAAVKEVCEDEMAKQASESAPPPLGRPAAGERHDRAYRDAVSAFPGMAAHRRPAAPPVAGAPPLRRRDGPSVGDMLEAKRRKIDKPADTPQGLTACFAAFYPGSPNKAKFERFAAEHDIRPEFLLALPASKCEDLLQKHGFEGVVVFTFQSRLREVCLG
ncbi:unnamed protein product [Pelagomonas calceolata]|uniref:Uncharacterized protein n=2 Tax=Pelagomonas calceolata TaxID=35677 RepID=A0A8J2X5L2_9STRA|nr:unnamed protein product [Pelagomonas calceolata]